MFDTSAVDAASAQAATAALLDHPEALRDVLRALAAAYGYQLDALVEWCSADVPGTPPDLPPLYYATLPPNSTHADMPLGLGESPSAALADLIWALGCTALLADVLEQRAAEPGPPEAPDAMPTLEKQ
jgi:hypothetical protein